jgi:hypothetical protein
MGNTTVTLREVQGIINTLVKYYLTDKCTMEEGGILLTHMEKLQKLMDTKDSNSIELQNQRDLMVKLLGDKGLTI